MAKAIYENGTRSFISKRSSETAFKKYITRPLNCDIDLQSLKTHIVTLSEIINSPLRLRGDKEWARVGFYQAPPTLAVAKLLFRASRAIRNYGPFWRELLAGAIILAIHPLNDGNGRLSRYFWIKGLARLGCDDSTILRILAKYYGSSKWLSGRANINSITALAGAGDIRGFLRQWQKIMEDFSN